MQKREETICKSRFCGLHIKLGKKTPRFEKLVLLFLPQQTYKVIPLPVFGHPWWITRRQGQPQHRKTKWGNEAEVGVTTGRRSGRQSEDRLAPERPAEDHEMDLTIGQWHVLIGIRMVQKQMLHGITGLDIWKIHVPIWVTTSVLIVTKACVLRHLTGWQNWDRGTLKKTTCPR